MTIRAEKSTIVVVAFTMKQKKSIGYRSFGTSYDAGEYVKKMLDFGAEVISLRRVYEE